MNVPRLMIAAPKSGSGKTSVTLAVIGALKAKGISVSSFKCGPDYIDPIFHRKYLKTKGYNLDLYLAGEENIKRLLCHGAEEISVIEGVMGYYDGIGKGTEGSSFELALKTNTPVLLVVDVSGSAITLAAVIRGLLEFYPESMIRGVILNRCSEGFYKAYADAIEKASGVKLYGYLPPMPQAAISSRHLGLDIIGEDKKLLDKLACLCAKGRETLDIAGIIELAQSAEDISVGNSVTGLEMAEKKPVKISVAKDEAFCFYYPENLELLQQLGAELEFFSPIRDREIPKESQGLYIGGGYPEVFAEMLSQNNTMKSSIKSALDKGMPAIAECGGFLYLQKSIEGEDGRVYPMCGVLKGHGERKSSLGNFGYMELSADSDQGFLKPGEVIRAHEFHYWHCHISGNLKAKKASSGAEHICGISEKNLYAAFPHLYLLSNISFAQRFVSAAEAYAL